MEDIELRQKGTQARFLETEAEERYYMASQRELIWRKFRKHKMARLSLYVLAFLYFIAFTYEFFAPYGPTTQHEKAVNMPPTRIHFRDSEGKWRWPFVYGMRQTVDLQTFQRTYVPDESKIHPLRFFAHGEPYRFWGRILTDWHLFDAGEGRIFLLGTDDLGRDLFSRILAGGRVSLTVGIVGVFISFVLGCIMGGISGFYGGVPDLIIQRLIEYLGSIPNIPLWMTLAAFIPVNWPVVKVYFAVTLILSLLGWTDLARVVRSKLLQLREQDYVVAAKLAGATDMQIIVEHLLPGFMSYLIVSITLAIPNMVLAETALSFLGLGLRPPAVSWGVLLQGAQRVTNIALRPWMLTPALLVILNTLLFNFVGDGLRDAADPYK